ncbi:MAG: hypothetical protein Q8N90_03980 [bacterium]|nr:hypothetical protein [bacterium]
MPSNVSMLACLIAFAPFFRWLNELTRITKTVAHIKHHRLIIKPLKAYGMSLCINTLAQPPIRGPPFQVAYFIN